VLPGVPPEHFYLEISVPNLPFPSTQQPQSVSVPSNLSTVKLQDIVDWAYTFGDIPPLLNVPQASAQPALTIATDVMNAICATPFPWKWNEVELPFFYTNSWQQDYALVNPDDSSVMNVAWLERGICVDINNTSIPKPWRMVECGRQLPKQTGTFFASNTAITLFLANWFPNYKLYYGTWGVGIQGSTTNPLNQTTANFGNNPVAGSIYTNPIGSGSMPPNPITQIKDSNNNLLVLTQYGTEGVNPPVAPPKSPAGFKVTGALRQDASTTVWTVVDPNGAGIRIIPAPAQTGVVWQFNLCAQMRPVRFTSLKQTLAPLTDEMEPHFRQGFIAQAYRYSPKAEIRKKFNEEWSLWLKSLNELRAKDSRELEENSFTPDRGIMGSVPSTTNFYYGPFWPFRYPVR
jgi:hypothetical protein